MIDSIPDSVQELANGCVIAVQNAIGIELDFTPETLPLLDHYLREAAVNEDEVATLIAAMAGAYYGEVVRRTHRGARWRVDSAHEGWRIEFETFYLSFNPLGVALESFVGEPAAGWGAELEMSQDDREVVQNALDRLGEIDADDYYRLAVRFEVLELTSSTLAALVSARGENVLLGPEVYAAASRARSSDN